VRDREIKKLVLFKTFSHFFPFRSLFNSRGFDERRGFNCIFLCGKVTDARKTQITTAGTLGVTAATAEGNQPKEFVCGLWPGNGGGLGWSDP
jgi:hypothetical protein